MATIQKRQVAIKSRIITLLKNEFIKKEGWEPSYILNAGMKISRANLIATLVSKEGGPMNDLIVDDGSGRICVRSFDDKEFGKKINVGEVVLLIGRPREYGEERYLLGELIKKIANKDWIKIRELELKYEKKPKETKEIKEEPSNIITKIISLIREIDQGEGADYEEVLSKSDDQKANNAIKNLLEQGEIFEIKPGKLKILV